MNLVVLDTDAVSSLWRGRPTPALQASLARRSPAITFVTLGELTKWTLMRHWGPRRLREMHAFLASLVVLPYEKDVARRWGEL